MLLTDKTIDIPNWHGHNVPQGSIRSNWHGHPYAGYHWHEDWENETYPMPAIYDHHPEPPPSVPYKVRGKDWEPDNHPLDTVLAHPHYAADVRYTHAHPVTDRYHDHKLLRFDEKGNPVVDPEPIYNPDIPAPDAGAMANVEVPVTPNEG